MANVIQQYKKMKTFDKVLIPVAFAALIGMAALLSGELNPLPIALGFLAFYAFVHFAVTKTASTASLVVLLLQTIMFLPATMIYGNIAHANGTMDDTSALILGALYMTAATYLTAWATWRWSAGRWWVRMLLGFIAIDMLVPLLMANIRVLNIYLAMALGLVFVALLCIPWSRLRANPAADLPENIKTKTSTDAVRQLIASLDGITVSDPMGPAADFIADNGKRRFHVCVLGKDRNIKAAGNSVQYGTANLKPLLFQMTREASKKKDVPVVVNYSDTSKSFVEVQSSLSADRRRGRHVIMTTPRKLVDLLKG